MGASSKVGIPADGMINMVCVLTKLDEEWTTTMSPREATACRSEVYETLYAALRASADSEVVEQGGVDADSSAGDEDDDSIGPVTLAFDSRAETTQTDIDTTL